MSQSSVNEAVESALQAAFRQLDACFDLQPSELEGCPEHQGAWSIAEHLEHVCLANHFLLLTIAKGCRKAAGRAAALPIPEGDSDLDLLAPVAVPGAFEWLPPSHMLPTGKRPLFELRPELHRQLAACLQLLAGMPRGEGRLCTVGMSVHGLGKLDMYQWLYFLAQHAAYHLAMIARLPGRGKG
jgi:hypothetical protein